MKIRMDWTSVELRLLYAKDLKRYRTVLLFGTVPNLLEKLSQILSAVAFYEDYH